MNETRPLLSICIPTYNRAELLKQCLESVISQSNIFGDKVEIIVSNNCSTDETEKTIKNYVTFGNIKYYQHPKNIGAVLNVCYIINHLANGEFCWIIGDDDLLRAGAIEKVLNVIESTSLDYIFMNHSYEWNRNFHQIEEIMYQKIDEINSPLCLSYKDQMVERWEDIIDFSEYPALYTSIVSSIFRRNTWKLSVTEYNHLENPFISLETTFTHTYTLSKHNVGKPAYYIGFPYVAFFVGAQEWLGEWKFLLLKYVLELSDLFEILGARKSMVDRYREIIFKDSHHDYLNVLFGKDRSPKIFIKHLIKYCRYSEYWKMLFTNIKSNVNLKSNIKKAIRRLVKSS